MAVSGVRGNIVSLVRNHETRIGEGPLQVLPASATYSKVQYGGNTNVYFNTKTGKWVESYGSLAGTNNNCAGGLTPWESWISCEETFQVGPDGKTHGKNMSFHKLLVSIKEKMLTSASLLRLGWIFDVPAFGLSNAQPIMSAGRFVHEATCTDPSTYRKSCVLKIGSYRLLR